MNPTPLLCLILLGASLAAARQADAPVPSGAPPPTDAPSLINAAPQAQQALPPNEVEGADGMPGTNDVNEAVEPGQPSAPTQAGDEALDNRSGGRSRRADGRQSRQNRFARERQRSRSARDSFGSGTDSGTNRPASLDYASFRVIAELNIFDPNRVPSGPRPVQGPSAEYFTLVGTAHYEKGTFAYFSGSSSKYEKQLKVSDSIAGYKLTDIGANSVKLAGAATNSAADPVKLAGAATNTVAGSVKLAGATNDIELRMGMQMRREETGPWQLAAAPSSSAAGSSLTPVISSESPGTNSAAPPGGENEVLKRLMQRRAQE
jgi:hypothetical protein